MRGDTNQGGGAVGILVSDVARGPSRCTRLGGVRVLVHGLSLNVVVATCSRPGDTRCSSPVVLCFLDISGQYCRCWKEREVVGRGKRD